MRFRLRRSDLKWLTPGIGIKRWIILLLAGITILGVGIAQVVVDIYREQELPDLFYILLLRPLPIWMRIIVAGTLGAALLGIALYELNRALLAPYRANQSQAVVDAVYAHAKKRHGPRVVAIGGGTGLPSVLRGMKAQTSNLTAIVTMADDGGSSGRLRRDLGVLPPGDLRNNIAALANDEDLMTQLFQYRFGGGDLKGHSFGNLFLTALSDITGSMDQALLETSRVLAVQGSVLPSTLEDITLMGEVWMPDGTGLQAISGEANIGNAGGTIERVFLTPGHPPAYPKSVQAMLAADLIVIGPGSLFTSILPNLLVDGIAEAIRASKALCVYVCNVATQPGETDGFNVLDHVLTIEKHVGPNLINTIVANNHFPTKDIGEKTNFVLSVPEEDAKQANYEIVYTNLTDARYPWRHDPVKLNRVLLSLYADYQTHAVRDSA